jgi:hypothetical protein
MLRISWVAAQWAASQEGLSSMSEWVSLLKWTGISVVEVAFVCRVEVSRISLRPVTAGFLPGSFFHPEDGRQHVLPKCRLTFSGLHGDILEDITLFNLWRMSSSGMWRRVYIVWTDISEERISSIFRVQKSASEEPAWAGDYPEDAGDTFFRNVGSHKIYTAPHPRRRHSS